MNLNHYALNIESIEEVDNFYINILGFNREYEFEIPSELVRVIFGVESNVTVRKVGKGNVFIELFVNPSSYEKGFSHICIETDKRNNIADKCLKSGYWVTRIVRDDRPDLTFVKDKAGNMFEIKDLVK